MRNAVTALIFAATTIFQSPALAASGAEYEGAGLLMIMFLGFGAMIIAFQLVLVATLLFGMVKALVAGPAAPGTLATEQSKHDS